MTQIDPQRLREFELTEAGLEVMKDQQAEYMRQPKHIRLKYERNLRAALLDLQGDFYGDNRVKEDREPKPRKDHDDLDDRLTPGRKIGIDTKPIRQPYPPMDPQVAWGGVFLGLILTPIGMAVFFLLLWVVTGGPWK